MPGQPFWCPCVALGSAAASSSPTHRVQATVGSFPAQGPQWTLQPKEGSTVPNFLKPEPPISPATPRSLVQPEGCAGRNTERSQSVAEAIPQHPSPVPLKPAARTTGADVGRAQAFAPMVKDGSSQWDKSAAA